MIEIRFEPEAQRFVAYDGEMLAGICSYRIENGTWVADHTEVSPEYRGQQVAQKLVEALFEHVEAENIQLVAECSYVVKMLARRTATND